MKEEVVGAGCYFNPGCSCIDKNCDHCGFNPAVEKKRIAAITANLFRKSVRADSKTKVRSRVLDGMVWDEKGLTCAKIELEIRVDKKGKLLALSAGEYGVMLMIPLETVGDMIQVRG